MRRLLPFLLVISGCSPIRVKGDPSFLKMQRLAVVAVTPGPDATCKKLAESAYSNIEQGFMDAGFRLAPRSQIQGALEQYGVKISTNINAKQADRLGKMLGVQGIVIPSCVRKGNVDWRLTILSAQSGKIVVNSTLFGSWPDSNAGVQRWVEKIKKELR